MVSGGPAFAAGWQAVLELVRHNDPRAEAAVSAAVYQLLSLFLLPRGMDERIEQAAAYMQEHCAEPLPVEALARLACMSPYHFQRRFKEETGLTVHQYLNRQRVGRAKQLLLSTALPVSKIAEQTGFSGSSHLAAVFKAMTGQAPRDYRRRL